MIAVVEAASVGHERSQVGEDLRLRPGSPHYLGSQPAGQDAGQIPEHAPAGDVGQALDRQAGAQPAHRLQVGAVRLQEGVQQRRPAGMKAIAQRLAGEHLAGQAVAVGVQAARGQRDQGVALADGGGVDQRLALADAHHEAGQVVGGRRIEARHLRRLASQQGAPGLAAGLRHPRHHVGDHARLEHAGGDVIEEEEWIRARGQHVVDAVVDQVDSEVGMPSGGAREQHLGPHSVGGGHQHRLLEAARLEREEAAERSDPGQHLGALGGLSQGPDQGNRCLTRFEVHARLAVGRHQSLPTGSSASLSISSCTGTGTG